MKFATEVVALYSEGDQRFLVTINDRSLAIVYFDRLLIAAGGHPFLPSFENNDLPGVISGRAVQALILDDGVLPGRRIACVGNEAEASRLAEIVNGAGGEAVAVAQQIVRAHGMRHVSAATVNSATGETRIECDLIAVCEPPAPSFELARAAGAQTSWDEKSQFFVVDANDDGQTAAKSIFAAGEVRGPMSEDVAVEQGRRSALAMAREVTR